MKINFGKIEVKIGIKQLDKNSLFLKLEDFNELNIKNLEYIQQLDKNVIQKRLDEISISNIKNVENVKKAKELLDNYGIFVIPDFYDKNMLTNIEIINKSLISQINNIYSENSNYHETDKYIIQGKESKYNTYNELANSKKTIVTIRQGQDEGMIDIFNYDLLNEINSLKIHNLESTLSLNEFMNSKMNLKIDNINLYVNKGILKTRGFHYDDFQNTVKSFVYLTDVEKLEDGPYCFVKGSHKKGFYRKINQSITQNFKIKTEAPVVSVLDIIPIIAQKGSLVVSNQTGIHRGIPQSENGYREVMVLRYK